MTDVPTKIAFDENCAFHTVVQELRRHVDAYLRMIGVPLGATPNVSKIVVEEGAYSTTLKAVVYNGENRKDTVYEIYSYEP